MNEIDQLRRDISEVETRCEALSEQLGHVLEAAELIRKGVDDSRKKSMAAVMLLTGRMTMLESALVEFFRAVPEPQNLAERLRVCAAALIADESEEPNQPYEQELTRTLAALLEALERPATGPQS